MKAETLFFAKAFWDQAGDPGPFPRNMERAITLALPVAIAKLSRLNVEVLAAWLAQRHVPIKVPHCDGEMAGCLFAHRGHAVIFVAATDPEDEVRGTLAHELAHLLMHYFALREQALRAVGRGILEVLDGDRPATFAERTKGLLRHAVIGPHVHVLPRDDSRDTVSRIERQADQLALQLVAPRAAVLAFIRQSEASTPRQRRAQLAERFGLPANWFHDYATDGISQSHDRMTAMLTQLRRIE
jgi:Zn-dependent peptidase ImmA (M78 family)